MSAMAIPAETETTSSEATSPETANDRFKKSFGSWLWGSMIGATVFHFMLFQFWPTQTAADISFSAADLEVIDVMPEIEIPPPPEAISKPATPVMAPTEIDDDITIALTTFEENPVEELTAPPIEVVEADLSAAPVFTPMTVFPEIKNRDEVRSALIKEYPPLLRNAGIGGQVVVWFFISEDGTVLDSRVSQPSVHTQLNEAALKVADVFRFSPALNRDKVVQVWIRLPITFQVN